jgi:hypothetical protein
VDEIEEEEEGDGAELFSVARRSADCEAKYSECQQASTAATGLPDD